MINAQDFFTHLLHEDDRVKAMLASDGVEPNIFEYPCEEELMDNPGKPYIIVQNTGTSQGEITKDDSFDPFEDTTNIDVLCVADGKSEIKELAGIARQAIAEAMDNFTYDDASTFGFTLMSSSYSDNGVMFDVESGNYFVTLKYRIETSI